MNLMPAFGPPTAAVVVLLGLNWRLEPVALAVLGACASGAGRYLLAAATNRLRDHLSSRRRESLEAARDYLTGHRGRSFGGLAIFLISPLPSAQMFEAAGLMGVRLLPITLAHILGRLVSYSVYLTVTTTIAERSLGETFLDSLTSPVGIGLQVVLLTAVILLTRIDWTKYLPPARQNGNTDRRQRRNT
ncbi:hypothetical protein [Nocardia blacklockiae]|uniref:hypothetical protein n=1 Tax=Nocardia blacklockiae TaxID=480036 RepID=UPI0018949D3C|nr:hypothetical protein [Nocardia blacklockiae]MBF6176604.1 hypothetical protein [Nocardia blacklockiae]